MVIAGLRSTHVLLYIIEFVVARIAWSVPAIKTLLTGFARGGIKPITHYYHNGVTFSSYDESSVIACQNDWIEWPWPHQSNCES